MRKKYTLIICGLLSIFFCIEPLSNLSVEAASMKAENNVNVTADNSTASVHRVTDVVANQNVSIVAKTTSVNVSKQCQISTHVIVNKGCKREPKASPNKLANIKHLQRETTVSSLKNKNIGVAPKISSGFVPTNKQVAIPPSLSKKHSNTHDHHFEHVRRVKASKRLVSSEQIELPLVAFFMAILVLLYRRREFVAAQSRTGEEIVKVSKDTADCMASENAENELKSCQVQVEDDTQQIVQKMILMNAAWSLIKSIEENKRQ